MEFENPHLIEICKAFIGIKENQILRDLHIKYLNISVASETLCKFMKTNKDYILKEYKYEGELFNGNKFYNEVIKMLKDAKNNGIALEMTPEEYIEYLKEKISMCHFVD